MSELKAFGSYSRWYYAFSSEVDHRGVAQPVFVFKHPCLRICSVGNASHSLVIATFNLLETEQL